MCSSMSPLPVSDSLDTTDACLESAGFAEVFLERGGDFAEFCLDNFGDTGDFVEFFFDRGGDLAGLEIALGETLVVTLDDDEDLAVFPMVILLLD